LRTLNYILQLARPVFRSFRRFHLFSASDEEIKNHAKNLRELACEYGLNHFPVILTEPGRCASCRTLTPVLMQPHEICGECWSARLDATIERDIQRKQ
jgi:hypothetical protein